MRRALETGAPFGLLLWVVLAGALAGCEGEDGPLYPEEDWPDFNFGVDATVLDAKVVDASAGPQPDAARPDGALDGALLDGAMRLDADLDGALLDGSAADADAPTPVLRRSAGCDQVEPHARGGTWIRAMDFGPAAGGIRGFYLTVPRGYDPGVPSRLIVGFPGTDGLGGRLRDKIGIEDGVANEIFVYPDPLWRDWGGTRFAGGWQLGPYGGIDAGDEDLHFTSALLDHMQDNYCIDLDRVFVTGHSWGGDMANFVSCFLGDRVRASAPAAARSPFHSPVDECVGQPATWTFFGIADDHFNLPTPGSLGDRARDYWVAKNNCTGVDAAERLDFGPEEQCFDYLGCDVPTRYCLYGPETAHQVPPYFSAAIMAFFRSF